MAKMRRPSAELSPISVQHESPSCTGHVVLLEEQQHLRGSARMMRDGSLACVDRSSPAHIGYEKHSYSWLLQERKIPGYVSAIYSYGDQDCFELTDDMCFASSRCALSYWCSRSRYSTQRASNLSLIWSMGFSAASMVLCLVSTGPLRLSAIADSFAASHLCLNAIRWAIPVEP